MVSWRKGPDLFLQVASVLQKRRPDLAPHFVWIGGNSRDEDWARFRGDVAAAGLSGRVHLVPAVARPLEWMRALDIFVLTAREDAFPLACLEAASVGVPIVCFDSGGMIEFLTADRGVVVPFPDVEGFAEALGQLLDDPRRRRLLGEAARAEVCDSYDVSVGAPRIFEHLRSWARP